MNNTEWRNIAIMSWFLTIFLLIMSFKKQPDLTNRYFSNGFEAGVISSCRAIVKHQDETLTYDTILVFAAEYWNPMAKSNNSSLYRPDK